MIEERIDTVDGPVTIRYPYRMTDDTKRTFLRLLASVAISVGRNIEPISWQEPEAVAPLLRLP